MLTDDTGLSSKDTAHRYVSIVYEVSVTVLLFLSKRTFVFVPLHLPVFYASVTVSLRLRHRGCLLLPSPFSFPSFSSFLCFFSLNPPIAVSTLCEFPPFASGSNVESIGIVETTSLLFPIVHVYRPR